MVAAASEFAGWKTGYGSECACGGSCAKERRQKGASLVRADDQEWLVDNPSVYTQGEWLNQWASGSKMESGSTHVIAEDGVTAIDYDKWFWPCGADTPDVSTVTPVVGEDEKICGTDVTDLLAELLSEVLSSSSWLAGGNMCRPGQEIDMKDSKYDTCSKNCGKTVTLCGWCVSEQVPGNIGFGAALGFVFATIVGRLVSEESGEDRTSYSLGSGLLESVDRGTLDPSSAADIKKALCARLQFRLVPCKKNDALDGIVTRACTICKDPAKRKRRPPAPQNCPDAIGAGMPSPYLPIDDGQVDPWLIEWSPSSAGFFR